MKKTVFKILTCIFCILLILITTILPTFANSSIPSTSNDNYEAKPIIPFKHLRISNNNKIFNLNGIGNEIYGRVDNQITVMNGTQNGQGLHFADSKVTFTEFGYSATIAPFTFELPQYIIQYDPELEWYVRMKRISIQGPYISDWYADVYISLDGIEWEYEYTDLGALNMTDPFHFENPNIPTFFDDIIIFDIADEPTAGQYMSQLLHIFSESNITETIRYSTLFSYDDVGTRVDLNNVSYEWSLNAMDLQRTSNTSEISLLAENFVINPFNGDIADYIPQLTIRGLDYIESIKIKYEWTKLDQEFDAEELTGNNYAFSPENEYYLVENANGIITIPLYNTNNSPEFNQNVQPLLMNKFELIINGDIANAREISIKIEENSNIENSVFTGITEWANNSVSRLPLFPEIEITVIEEPPPSMLGWIMPAVDGFFSIPIFGEFTLGNILWVVIGIGVVFAVLKYFAGG